MISIVVKVAFFLMCLWPWRGVVRGCGCCRPNLGAAGGSAAPSSPSPLQVILLILLPLCADFARCVYSLHPFCAMCVIIFLRNRCVCARACVRARGTTYPLLPEVTMHMCVFLPPCGITADHSGIEHWVAPSAGVTQTGSKCGRSCPWPAVHI